MPEAVQLGEDVQVVRHPGKGEVGVVVGEEREPGEAPGVDRSRCPHVAQAT
jgi:hypothetical protein